jgi:hypothetical protein
MGKRSGRISAVQQAKKEEEWAAMAEAAGAGAGPMPYAQLSQTGSMQQQQQGVPAASEAPSVPSSSAPPPAAGSTGPREEDARRFPLHRRLMAAAAAGDYQGAEEELAAMAAAGFEPGPRAWHTLVMAYLKGGDREGGLEVAARAGDAGECVVWADRGAHVSRTLTPWCAAVVSCRQPCVCAIHRLGGGGSQCPTPSCRCPVATSTLMPCILAP